MAVFSVSESIACYVDIHGHNNCGFREFRRISSSTFDDVSRHNDLALYNRCISTSSWAENMNRRGLLAYFAIGVVVVAIVSNVVYLGALYPYKKEVLYHTSYGVVADLSKQNNAVLVSANARLIWWLSAYEIEIIDLSELANNADIGEDSARMLTTWIVDYLQSGRTVFYLVTWFEIAQHREYGHFQNDFSFFLNKIIEEFETRRVMSLPTSPGEYVLQLSIVGGVTVNVF